MYIFSKIETNYIMQLYRLWTRFRYGIVHMVKFPKKSIIAIVLTIAICKLYENNLLLKGFTTIAATDFSTILFIFIFIILVFLFSQPITAYTYERCLFRAGITNHAGEAPVFYEKVNNTDSTSTLYFFSIGISLENWNDAQEKIAQALNVYITDIKRCNNQHVIALTVSSVDFMYYGSIAFDDTVIPESPSKISVGECFGVSELIDLNVVPHILIGGSTGSGKSILLKSLLYQLIQKNCEVYISDFKGGVDFSDFWKSNSTFLIDVEQEICVLKHIVEDVLPERKKCFNDSDVRNIDEYNVKYNGCMKRIIVACDEISELLDKTGLTKDDKANTLLIERYLSTIARQGRAFGIHLMLATQRSGANILTGQIKNNIDYRICGRADQVLSTIILDNGDASVKIPKDAQGVFLNHQGKLIKGYYIDI